MEKVAEPNKINEVWQCERCNQHHCGDCVDAVKVDFDIKEDIGMGYNDADTYMHNWKGQEVCPWCYNQLIDLK